MLVGFDGCAFGFAGWVAESKDDGSFVESGHVFEDFRRESTSDSSSTCVRKNKALQFPVPSVSILTGLISPMAGVCSL